LFSDVNGVVYGDCADNCDINDITTEGCFFTDFGNKQGPLCYVGQFGLDATIVGCGKGGYCVVKGIYIFLLKRVLFLFKKSKKNFRPILCQMVQFMENVQSQMRAQVLGLKSQVLYSIFQISKASFVLSDNFQTTQ
jgi:hypothetical protein